MSELKIKVGKAALAYIEGHTIIGVGSGTTVYYFIKELAKVKHHIDACVVSSKKSESLLKEIGIPVLDLNMVDEVPVYIDGADEVNAQHEMIKGGGGALTREKILATVAKQFVCIVDETKVVLRLGKFPIAVEVIPMARSYVARELVKMGGDPQYREDFVTDNGNIILDVFNINMNSSNKLEDAINTLPGVVENGVFARRRADLVLVAGVDGVTTI